MGRAFAQTNDVVFCRGRAFALPSCGRGKQRPDNILFLGRFLDDLDLILGQVIQLIHQLFDLLVGGVYLALDVFLFASGHLNHFTQFQQLRHPGGGAPFKHVPLCPFISFFVRDSVDQHHS